MNYTAIGKSWKDAVLNKGATARGYDQNDHHMTKDQCTGHVAIWLRKRAFQKGDRFWEKYMDVPSRASPGQYSEERYKSKESFQTKVRDIHSKFKSGDEGRKYILGGSDKSKVLKGQPIERVDLASFEAIMADPSVLNFLMDTEDGKFMEKLVTIYKGRLSDIGLFQPEAHAVGLDLRNSPNEAVWFDPCVGEIGMRSDIFVPWFVENWKPWEYRFKSYTLAVYQTAPVSST